MSLKQYVLCVKRIIEFLNSFISLSLSICNQRVSVIITLTIFLLIYIYYKMNRYDQCVCILPLAGSLNYCHFFKVLDTCLVYLNHESMRRDDDVNCCKELPFYTVTATYKAVIISNQKSTINSAHWDFHSHHIHLSWTSKIRCDKSYHKQINIKGRGRCKPSS